MNLALSASNNDMVFSSNVILRILMLVCHMTSSDCSRLSSPVQHASPAASSGGRPRPASGYAAAPGSSPAAAGDAAAGSPVGVGGGLGSRLEAALVALGVKLPPRGPADPLEPFLSESWKWA
jgi:hypothetical protein